MRKNNTGFTIIEVMVVVIIIGIIATIATLSYVNIQKEARDSKKQASAVNLAESLERYYSRTGEYPSVTAVTNPNAAIVKQTLSVATINSLLSPTAPVGSNVNAWKNGTTSITNQLTYTPNTDTSTSCATGSTATDTCADFKLQYYKEKTNTVETIYSRHKAIAGAPTPPPAPTITAPTAPTITASISGSNAIATRTDTSCRAGAQLFYAFRSRTNDGTWSSYTAWGSATSSSLAAAQGSKYGFQVKAKCVEGDYSSADAVSTEATAIRTISAPAAPSVYTTASFRPNYNGGLCIDAAGQGNVNGTVIQVYNCNGTVAQDWAYNSNDRTIRPTYNMNLCITNQGSGMQLVLWTCDGHVARQWNYDTRGYLVSVSNGQCMDAANWGPSGSPINAWNCNNATAQIWNPSDTQTAWDWADTACPAGTTVEYRVDHQMTNTANSGWISNGTTSRLVRTTTPQGYTYTTQVGARCYNTYDPVGAWSANGSSSINKAVLRPGAAYGWTFGVWGDRRGWGWSWASPACGAGTNKTYIEESWMGVNNNSGGSIEYWLAPRVGNGPGNVWWYTANSSSGAAYIWYAPDVNDRGDTYVGHPSGPIMYGLDVIARTQYRCHNPTTGREAIGDWTQTGTNYT